MCIIYMYCNVSKCANLPLQISMLAVNNMCNEHINEYLNFIVLTMQSNFCHAFIFHSCCCFLRSVDGVFFLFICRFLCILYRSTIYGEQPMPISFIKIVEIFTFSLWLFLKSLEAHQLSKHTHHNLISFPLIC